jgi:hypothetical protein
MAIRKTNLELTIIARPNSFVNHALSPHRCDTASPIERPEKSRWLALSVAKTAERDLNKAAGEALKRQESSSPAGN